MERIGIKLYQTHLVHITMVTLGWRQREEGRQRELLPYTLWRPRAGEPGNSVLPVCGPLPYFSRASTPRGA